MARPAKPKRARAVQANSATASGEEAAELTAPEERRGFVVIDPVEHDGETLTAGDIAWLTEVQLDMLRRAGVVDPQTGWLDGGSEEDDSPPPEDPPPGS